MPMAADIYYQKAITNNYLNKFKHFYSQMTLNTYYFTHFNKHFS